MLDVIAKRKSVRKYDGQPLPGPVRSEVEAVLAKERVGPFGGKPRFALVDRDVARGEKGIKLGTYGFIKDARTFVAGAIARGPQAEVDYGYALEAIILELTALGLGTCWLGGTFSRAEYGTLLALEDDELVPAVTPVGVAAESRGVVERLVRWGAKADSRLPWETLFFDGALGNPLDRETTGPWGDVLEAVRQAPSASNKQPWRILRDGGRFHLLLVRTPGYRKMIAAADLQRIDMGIAMCHFETAAHALGLPGSWHTDAPSVPIPESAEHIACWRAGE
jgi:nitroreductase